MKKTLLTLSLCLTALILIKTHSFAADASYYLPCIEEANALFGENPCAPGTGDFRNYISRFFGFAYATAGIIGVGMIAFGGFLYAVSDIAGKKQEGEAIIKRTVWGILLLMGSYFILQTVNPAIVDFSKLPGGQLGDDILLEDNTIIPSAPCLGDSNDKPGENCRSICKTPEDLSNMCPLDSDKAKEKMNSPESCVLCSPDPQNPSFCAPSVFNCALDSGLDKNKWDDNTFSPDEISVEILPGGITKATLLKEKKVEIPECEKEGDALFSGELCDDFEGWLTDTIPNTDSITIKPGGQLWFYPYYPRNEGLDKAACFIYAYRIEEDSYIHQSDLLGMIKC